MNKEHLHPDGRPYTKEEFINKIKTDDEFAKKWGELGPIYGKQWRNWKTTSKMVKRGPSELDVSIVYEPLDQIQNLINDLKTNPDSRRLMVSAWNVGELDQMVLPPCHHSFQVYTRELSYEEKKQYTYKYFNDGSQHDLEDFEKFNIPTRAISLMFNMRSNDVPLGLPFNLASYGLLLEIIGKMVNMIPDELITNMGDCHIYKNQIDGVIEHIGRELSLEERYNIWFDKNYETGMERFFDPNNLPNFDDKYYERTPKRTREPYPLPKLVFGKTDEFFKLLGEDLSLITHLDNTDFVIENYQSHPTIKMPLSN